MERKSLTVCLKRSLSWSVNARCAAGHEQSVGLLRKTKENSSATEEDTPLKGAGGNSMYQLIDEALKKGSKSELDMSGLLARELHTKAVDNTTLEFPEAVKDLKWITRLDVSGNGLVALPESLGELVNLTSLVVSENELLTLPSSIGKLKELTILRMEKNRIEELPWAIGQCNALTHFNGDFNNLKALPDVVGRLGKLKSLSVHLNCLKSLPKSMASMSSLVELDVRFNHLEDIPENLCLVTSLVRLNLASNFSKLKNLPDSIGRLQRLRELDGSFNNLTSLPDSFALLTNLQSLNLEGNPLMLPPLQIAQQGKAAVLNFMIQYVEKRENDEAEEEERSFCKACLQIEQAVEEKEWKSSTFANMISTPLQLAHRIYPPLR